MSLEKSERYLFIGIDEDLPEAQVTSFIRVWTNFLDKRCKQYPDSYKVVSDQYDDDEIVGREYTVDKKLLPTTIFKAPSKKKPLTAEEKKVVADRLQKNRKPREKKTEDKTT